MSEHPVIETMAHYVAKETCCCDRRKYGCPYTDKNSVCECWRGAKAAAKVLLEAELEWASKVDRPWRSHNQVLAWAQDLGIKLEGE